MDCPICLETCTPRDMFMITECNHMFHCKCINKWFVNKDSCPCCRKVLLTHDLCEEEPEIVRVYIELDNGETREIEVDTITSRRAILDYGDDDEGEQEVTSGPIVLDYGEL